MSVKIKTSWSDNNVIVEGVRIYKSLAPFDAYSRPEPLVEILDGSLVYEDFGVEYGQTYFYMLSCFLGEQEVFTECFEVLAAVETFAVLDFISSATTPIRLSSSSSPAPLQIPAHNAGDIIIVLKQGTDNELSSYGFTQAPLGASTHAIKPWFKIAKTSQGATSIPITASFSPKACVILRPSKPVNEVNFDLGSAPISVRGYGDSDTQIQFTTPLVDVMQVDGFFVQVVSTVGFATYGSAQLVTATPSSLLLFSPKKPTVYMYSYPGDNTVDGYYWSGFGSKTNIETTKSGGYAASINKIPNSNNTFNFLNLQITAK